MTELFETSDSPTHKHMACTVVVPCYNEALRLPTLAFEHFFECTHAFRFLFVNDGSTDSTSQVLRSLQAAFPQCVDVVDCSRNQGKAEAVRIGLLHAISEHNALFVGYWDADLATPLSELPRLYNILTGNPALVMLLGSRVRLQGRSVLRRPMRHYSGRIFATLASLTLGLPIYDTQCGAKLFRDSPVLLEILSSRFQSRWIFDVELLARLITIHSNEPRFADFAIYEEPLLSWVDVQGSKLKMHDSLRAISDLFHIRRTYFMRPRRAVRAASVPEA